MIEGLDKQDYEKIDKYLNGLLIDTELTEFEVRLQNESKLKNEVDGYIELNEGLAFKFNSNKDEVKATLNNLGDQYFLNKNVKVETEAEIRQTQTFTKPEKATIEAGEKSKRKPVKPLYLLATFAAAAALLLFLFNPFADQLSSSQLLAGQYFEVYETQTFQKVAQESSNIYKQIANWYLAMCYLKQDYPDKAIPLLQGLQSHKDFGNDAKSILKQLK